MKNDVIKKSKQIAIPNNTQRKKVDKIANQVFSLVNKEAEKQKCFYKCKNCYKKQKKKMTLVDKWKVLKESLFIS